MVIARRLSVFNNCTSLHRWLLFIEPFHTQRTNNKQTKRNRRTAHSITLLSTLGEIQAMINLKGYMVQKRFLMLTFSAHYKQCHSPIAFVAINPVLRGSLPHGCNTKGQEKSWAVRTGPQRHRAICVQVAGALSELCAVDPSLVGGTQNHLG